MQESLSVEAHPAGAYLDAGRRTTVAPGPGRPAAGDRADDPRRRDLSDALIPAVGDEDVPLLVHGDPIRVPQAGGRGRATVAVEPGIAPSPGDDPLGTRHQV